MVELGSDGGAQLDADIQPRPGGPVVRLRGELDLSSVDALADLIGPLIESTPDRLVFDLEDLSFMDSSGLALLLRSAARVGTVVLRRPSTIVRRVLDTTGVSEVMKIEP